MKSAEVAEVELLMVMEGLPIAEGTALYTEKSSTKMLATFEVLFMPINVVALIVLPALSWAVEMSSPTSEPFTYRSNF